MRARRRDNNQPAAAVNKPEVQKNTEADNLANNADIIAVEEEDEQSKPDNKAKQGDKAGKAKRLFRKIVNNPNFNFQLIVILLTFAADNVQMDRGISGLTSTVDKVRNITEVVNGAVQSIKAAAAAPQNIRKLLQ